MRWVPPPLQTSISLPLPTLYAHYQTLLCLLHPFFVSMDTQAKLVEEMVPGGFPVLASSLAETEWEF